MKFLVVNVLLMKLNIKFLRKIELSEFDLRKIEKDDLKKGISNYQRVGYEGKGLLIALGNDGFWRKYELGHCSCFGPLESGLSGKYTDDEIIKIIENEKIGDYYSVEDKKEILKYISKNKRKEK